MTDAGQIGPRHDAALSVQLRALTVFSTLEAHYSSDAAVIPRKPSIRFLPPPSA